MKTNRKVIRYKICSYFLCFTIVIGLIISFTGCQLWKRDESRMPSWVRDVVFTSEEFKYAYENGYFDQKPTVGEINGVKFTVWGAITNPFGTYLIYTFEGLEENSNPPIIEITQVDGESTTNKGYDGDGPNGYTSYGYLGTITTEVLPKGKHELTIIAHKSPNLTEDIEVNVTVDADAMSHLYQTVPINYKKTVDGVTIEGNRLTYSPVQAWVEFTASGNLGSDITFGGSSEDDDMYVAFANDVTITRVAGVLTLSNNDKIECVMTFDRPKNAKGATFVIPTLTIFESDEYGELIKGYKPVGEFSLDDMGKEKQLLDKTLTMTDWRVSPTTLEVDILYHGSVSTMINEWDIIGSDGEIIDTRVDTIILDEEYSLQNKDEIGFKYTYVFTIPPLEEGVKPVKMTALTEKFNTVKGLWQIPIPLPDKGAEPSKDAEQRYLTVKEAITAVKEKNSEDLVVFQVMLSYQTQEDLLEQTPEYLLRFYQNEIVNDEIEAVFYKVGSTVEKYGEQRMVNHFSEEDFASLKENEQLFTDREDKTLQVVELAKDKGRDIADEAYSLGVEMISYYSNDNWFLIQYEDKVQVAYNVESKELILSDNSRGMSWPLSD